MEDVHERSQLGYRILHLSKDSGVSDFYITPWEQLTYKRNGKLYFDSFVYQPERPIEVVPGCADYAISMGGRRYRVNRMVTRGRPRWTLRLLPETIRGSPRRRWPPRSPTPADREPLRVSLRRDLTRRSRRQNSLH
jgi:twitching motility protein PilT